MKELEHTRFHAFLHFMWTPVKSANARSRTWRKHWRILRWSKIIASVLCRGHKGKEPCLWILSIWGCKVYSNFFGFDKNFEKATHLPELRLKNRPICREFHVKNPPMWAARPVSLPWRIIFPVSFPNLAYLNKFYCKGTNLRALLNLWLISK